MNNQKLILVATEGGNAKRRQTKTKRLSSQERKIMKMVMMNTWDGKGKRRGDESESRDGCEIETEGDAGLSTLEGIKKTWIDEAARVPFCRIS